MSKQSNSVDFRKAAVNCTKGPRLACVSTTDLVVHLSSGVSVLHFFFFQISFFSFQKKKVRIPYTSLVKTKIFKGCLEYPFA